MADIPESANKGLENIVACTSEISTIFDVTLLYRGYTIEDLSEHCGFEEIVYLLWEGKLPNRAQLDAFSQDLHQSMNLPSEFMPVLEKIAATQAHPMSKLRTAISHYALLDSSNVEDISPANTRKLALRLTGAFGPIVAALSRYEQGQKPVAAQPGKTIAWNFLNMVRGKAPTAEEERLYDTALVLHADHELNASTFTARVVASTTSDYYSDIVGAICSLKGPLHGGANEAVMIMLKEIGSMAKVDAYVADAIDNKKKVMGIGHRVYKNGDPRARILKELSLETCKKAGLEEQHRMLVRIQETMESKKGLMPNVDFFSGLVYTALGIRSRDFTPIFAMSRVSGWSAQVFEQYANNRIYRPRAFFTGPTNLKVKPIEQR
ncbi:MAG TPA: citrate/2-methylcitrate synthase [Bdellovibrionota bacterium]|jgi:citrate synthase|nr:citrate/2-methylcitrate synthase [Bdellovibrionota bacterium]